MLPCLAIASSVTAIGQQMIKTTAQVVQDKFNATVIYGDTDSVMVNFHCGEGPDAVTRALELGKQAAKLVTKHFKEPNELEFEKVYMPYILYSKKRYAGQMYTTPEKPDKIDIKGLQVVRRDNSQLQRDILRSLIKTMVQPISAEDLALYPGLSKVDVTRQRLAQLVRDFNTELISNLLPIDRFVISQSISKRGYETVNSAGQKSASLGHVKLAQRMEMREPGTGPVSGDRVQFVVVREAPHLAHIRNRTIDGVSYAAKDWPPRHERCEDPAFVKKHNMTLDLEYYLNNQLKNSVISLLEPIYPRSEELFEEAERTLKSRTSGNRMLTSFFAPKPKTNPLRAAVKGQPLSVEKAQSSGIATPADNLNEQGAEQAKEAGVQTQRRIQMSPPEQKRAQTKIPASPPGKQKGSPTTKGSSPSKGRGAKGGSQFMENFLAKRPAATIAHGQLPLPDMQKKHATDASVR